MEQEAVSSQAISLVGASLVHAEMVVPSGCSLCLDQNRNRLQASFHICTLNCTRGKVEKSTGEHYADGDRKPIGVKYL